MFYSNLFEIEYKKTFPFVKISKSNLFAIFFISLIVGVLAFIMETLVDYVAEYKLYDRGFLIGPFIPLYFFVVFFMLCYVKTPMYSVSNFLKHILIIGTSISFIEFVVGNLCEMIFGVALWNYDNSLPLSWGYFSITVGFIWGVLGSLLLFFVVPLLKSIADKISNKGQVFIATIFNLLFLSDIFLSLTLVIKNGKYKELYGPIKGDINTTLFVISFIMFILSAFTLLVLINIKRKPTAIYIIYFLSLIFPIVSFFLFFQKTYDLWATILLYIGYLVILFYMSLLLIYTIHKLHLYKKTLKKVEKTG